MIDSQQNIIVNAEKVDTNIYYRLNDSALKLFELPKSVNGSVPTKYFDFKSVNQQQLNSPLTERKAAYICKARLNDIRYINQYLEKVNANLSRGDYILVNLETMRTRADRLNRKYPLMLFFPIYFIDFILTRIAPKLSLTKNFYFASTNGKNQVISLPEAMARLFYCGFKVLNHTKIGELTYISAKKVDVPAFDSTPTNGILVKLRRVGKDEKLITVYKIRTMHPYSEYLQEYLFEKNGTPDGDKIENDFRVTYWGRFMRKFWIDELPMFWNWLKGELKIVGVRPLSKHKFYTYPEYLQKKRIRYKPGLIPPYYADLPQTPDEFFESENRYLDAYEKHPIRTDLRYFFSAVYNIVIRGERSQ